MARTRTSGTKPHVSARALVAHNRVILRLLSKHFWTGHPKFFLGGQMSFLYLVFTTFGQKNVFFCLLVGFFYIKKT